MGKERELTWVRSLPDPEKGSEAEGKSVHCGFDPFDDDRTVGLNPSVAIPGEGEHVDRLDRFVAHKAVECCVATILEGLSKTSVYQRLEQSRRPGRRGFQSPPRGKNALNDAPSELPLRPDAIVSCSSRRMWRKSQTLATL